ncbi:MAG: L-rhamnose/proton symporter RhaT, partial [Acidobacteria bacterium]|nr:L-rhamnose/proton symporter RhaT [Acidobacteriota bacterium]
MAANPLVGVVYHWLGGLASGSFYVPYRWVKRWAWETYWLAGGIFSWIIAPWTLALIMTKDLPAVLKAAPSATLGWAFFFGLLWGVGGLTFGLTMRYLGLSLGMAVVLGLCAAFGTLMPPIFRGVFVSQVLGTTSGRVIVLGIVVCLLGIAAAGLAGISKERTMSREQQQEVIKEFNLRKGIGVAVLSGVMSACFAYGLAAGDPIRLLTLQHGTAELWQGLPVLVVVLIGGFLTNFIWCLALLLRNKTGHQFFSGKRMSPGQANEIAAQAALDLPGRQALAQVSSAANRHGRAIALEPPPLPIEPREAAPMLRNYMLCALAGITWYFQFFFYTMGETQMGRYRFSSWTLHMASIIIFSSLWGIG